MAGPCLRLGGLPTVDKADSHPSPPAGSTRGRRSARPSRSPGRCQRRQGHQRGDEADQGRKAGHPAVLPRRGFQGRPGRSRAEADRTARDTSGADGNIKTASATLTADECRTVEAHLDQIITSADRTNNIKAVNGSKNAKDQDEAASLPPPRRQQAAAPRQVFGRREPRTSGCGSPPGYTPPAGGNGGANGGCTTAPHHELAQEDKNMTHHYACVMHPDITSDC